MVFSLTVERVIRAMKEGGEHIMDEEDNNNLEWAVCNGGGGGDHEIDFWANVQQHNCLLS